MSSKWRYSGVPGADLHDALRACMWSIKVDSYLEIGVDGGGSLRTVLEEASKVGHIPTRIDLCDLWTNHAGHKFTNFDHIKPILKSFGATATFHQGDSGVTVPNITGSFDLILVDGDHSFEAAYTDLTNAWPLLRLGGLLVLDDIGHHVYPGVLEAYRQFTAAEPNYHLVEEEGAPWRNTAILMKR